VRLKRDVMYVFMEIFVRQWNKFLYSRNARISPHKKKKKHKSRMSRIIDFSKWDKLKHSSSSSSSSSSSEEDDDDDEGEKEAGITRSALLENLSLCCSSSSSSPIWTGLVLHHKDIFVSHVLSKLNRTDRFFFSMVNSESQDVLKYAGVDVSKLRYDVGNAHPLRR
jgi:hypothetical protein